MAFHLDADVAQLASSSGSFAEHAATFHGLIDQASATAQQAQAVHQGESSTAFQQAHAQFQDAAEQLKNLTNTAHSDIGSAGSTYTSADAQHASDLLNTIGSMPTSLPHLA
jgi:WXG100 family type VII secretion target